jgi:hypothetical protein
MLRKSGVISSLLLGLILLSALLSLACSIIWSPTNSAFVASITNNWLITIFKIHANILPSEPNPLLGINLNDIVILILFILTCLSFLRKSQKHTNTWIIVASSLMILGILIFLITHLAGRSSFMASGIIISFLLFSGVYHNKIAGSSGLIANLLLLIGDFTVNTHLKIIPVLFGMGYLLAIIWIFLLMKIIAGTNNDSTNT